MISQREIAKHIEREVIRPGAHVPAFRPIAFPASLSEMVAPLLNMVYDLTLHISKSALRESMREQPPLLCMLLWVDCCEGTCRALLGILNGPVPIRLNDV